MTLPEETNQCPRNMSIPLINMSIYGGGDGGCGDGGDEVEGM